MARWWSVASSDPLPPSRIVAAALLGLLILSAFEIPPAERSDIGLMALGAGMLLALLGLLPGGRLRGARSLRRAESGRIRLRIGERRPDDGVRVDRIRSDRVRVDRVRIDHIRIDSAAVLHPGLLHPDVLGRDLLHHEYGRLDPERSDRARADPAAADGRFVSTGAGSSAGAVTLDDGRLAAWRIGRWQFIRWRPLDSDGRPAVLAFDRGRHDPASWAALQRGLVRLRRRSARGARGALAAPGRGPLPPRAPD